MKTKFILILLSLFILISCSNVENKEPIDDLKMILEQFSTFKSFEVNYTNETNLTSNVKIFDYNEFAYSCINETETIYYQNEKLYKKVNNQEPIIEEVLYEDFILMIINPKLTIPLDELFKDYTFNFKMEDNFYVYQLNYQNSNLGIYFDIYEKTDLKIEIYVIPNKVRIKKIIYTINNQSLTFDYIAFQEEVSLVIPDGIFWIYKELC